MSDENEQAGNYGAKAHAVAADAIRKGTINWTDEQVAAAADVAIARGFGRPGTGFTARVVANILRIVVPGADFALAKETVLYLNVANRELTGADSFDPKPYRCTHCGDRFATPVSPRTHWSNHNTVFDPRAF